MKRLLWLFGLLVLAACMPGGEEAEVPTPSPTATPAVLEQVFVNTPLETEAPLPVPTEKPTEEPTATPHPYRSQTVTEHPDSDAFWYGTVTETLKARIVGMSFPLDADDCPVSMEELRYLRILHVDFSGNICEGELLVHEQVAAEVLDIFYQLYEASYPLTSVLLVDTFEEPFSDNRSMEADNTSAFCCRRVTGSRTFSRHSYGLAIDINPVENPYIRPDGSFAPPNSEPYLDRENKRSGMIDEEDLCYRLFTAYGWSWGGHFKGEKDYQHFSKELDG